MDEGSIFYCPRCGKQDFRLFNPNKFECEHCTFTVYRNVAAAVVAIIEYDHKIIVTRREKEPGKGKLDLPGGFVDENQTLEESLEREVQEELGLKIHDLSYLCSYPNKYPYKGIEYSTIDSIFTCKADSINITREEKEIAGVEILDPKELNLDDIAFISIRKALERYLEDI
jgi:NAD+ diphosphatase